MRERKERAEFLKIEEFIKPTESIAKQLEAKQSAEK